MTQSKDPVEFKKIWSLMIENNSHDSKFFKPTVNRKDSNESYESSLWNQVRQLRDNAHELNM